MDIINQVDSYIEKFKKLDCVEFSKISKCYLLTTENIKSYLASYNLNKKDVLSVAGSFDQALNAYLLGANSVTLFDVNILAKYNASLKRSAIISLSYDDFIDFYINSCTVLDNSLFRKIDDCLKVEDQDASEFYNYLYNKYNPVEIREKIYQKFNPSLSKMKKMNFYFNPRYYEYLKNILKNNNFNFINCNLKDLRDNIGDDKFDVMLFSNISDYIDKMYNVDALKNYKELILNLSNNLNSNGIIQLGYIYSNYSDAPLFVKKCRNKAFFPESDFNYSKVTSYDSSIYLDLHDTVVTYKKK